MNTFLHFTYLYTRGDLHMTWRSYAIRLQLKNLKTKDSKNFNILAQRQRPRPYFEKIFVREKKGETNFALFSRCFRAFLKNGS